MTLTCCENEKAGLLIKLTTEFKQCVNDFSLSLQLPCTPTNSHGPLVRSPSASFGLWQKKQNNPHQHLGCLIAFAPCPDDDRDKSTTAFQFSFSLRTFHFNYLKYFILFYLTFLLPRSSLPIWNIIFCGSVAVSFGFSKQDEAQKERTCHLLSDVDKWKIEGGGGARAHYNTFTILKSKITYIMHSFFLVAHTTQLRTDEEQKWQDL